jgi:hypothetical protein
MGVTGPSCGTPYATAPEYYADGAPGPLQAIARSISRRKQLASGLSVAAFDSARTLTCPSCGIDVTIEPNPSAPLRGSVFTVNCPGPGCSWRIRLDPPLVSLPHVRITDNPKEGA